MPSLGQLVEVGLVETHVGDEVVGPLPDGIDILAGPLRSGLLPALRSRTRAVRSVLLPYGAVHERSLKQLKLLWKGY